MTESIEKKPLDYREALKAFGAALADASLRAAEACTNPMERMATDQLVQGMVYPYQNHVKSVFAKALPDPLEQRLGNIFSSFIGNTSAAHLNWTKRIAETQNIYPPEAIALEILADIVRYSQEHTEAALNAASSLLAKETRDYANAQLFAKLVFNYARASRMEYVSSGHWKYSISDICINEFSRASVSFGYRYYDGVDEGGGLLDAIFCTDALRDKLKQLANLAFGRPVEFLTVSRIKL